VIVDLGVPAGRRAQFNSPKVVARMPAHTRAGRLRRWLVDIDPELADVFHRAEELRELGRFGDVGIGAGVVGALQVARLGRRGQHHHRDVAQRVRTLDFLEHADAVEQRHLQVQQHQNRVAASTIGKTVAAVQVVQRLHAVGHVGHAPIEAVARQRQFGQLGVVGVVFNQQDGFGVLVHGSRTEGMESGDASEGLQPSKGSEK
jgi:hypothetical protein